jgi:hypothetical protein
MTIDNEDTGRGALHDRLPRHAPPAALRERVRHTLEARGLVGTAGTGRVVRVVAAAAAALVIFFAGLFAGSLRASMQLPSAEAPVQPRYALILYGGLAGDEGAEHDRRAREYGAWARALAGEAKWVGGEELDRAIAVYPSAPAPEEDPVVGFFLIDATSADVAKRIAQDCPHLKYGGRVVVHPVAS